MSKLSEWAKKKYESTVYWNKVHESFLLTTPKTPNWWVRILKWLSK